MSYETNVVAGVTASQIIERGGYNDPNDGSNIALGESTRLQRYSLRGVRIINFNASSINPTIG